MSKKKSAMQKGYRKQVKARPFLTKKEIYTLIGIVIAVILAVVLFNLFYDDGFMGVKDIKENDLVTYASSEIRNRYKKVAEVGEKEGFVRTSTANETSPIGTFMFTPESEEGNMESFTIGASFVNASSLTESFMAYVGDIGVEVMEPVETTINGRPAYVFAYEASYYSAENDPNAAETAEASADADIAIAENEPNTFEQHLSAYIAYDDTHTVSMHLNYSGEDESYYMPHEEVEATIQQYTDVFTMDFDAE